MNLLIIIITLSWFAGITAFIGSLGTGNRPSAQCRVFRSGFAVGMIGHQLIG